MWPDKLGFQSSSIPDKGDEKTQAAAWVDTQVKTKVFD